MKILGIESSCDDTSISVIDEYNVVSTVTKSQLIHREFGGVVPELASRKHADYIKQVYQNAMQEAKLNINDIDAIAVTFAPGLVGSLIVGLNFAKGLSFASGRRLIGIHHMEGHIASNYIENPDWKPPYIALLVSGGHSLLVFVKDWFNFEIIGKSVDDAVGEAFDKTAKVLDLPYPGGPEIDKLAKKGNPKAINFPVPYINNQHLNFSYSGLKTSVLNYIKMNNSVKKADIAASFQKSAIDALMIKCKRALKSYSCNKLAIAGGVSANSYLRESVKQLEENGTSINMPNLKYCMDNGAMIAMAGLLRAKNNDFSDLKTEAKPILNLGSRLAYE